MGREITIVYIIPIFSVIVPNTLYILTYLKSTTALWGYYTQFAYEETVPKRD